MDLINHFCSDHWTVLGYYDPATDRWRRLPLPSAGVWPIAAAAFTGRLYFLVSFMETPWRSGWRSVSDGAAAA